MLFRAFYCLFFFQLATKIEISTRCQDSTLLSAQHERAKKYCQESMLFGAFNLLFLKSGIWTYFHYGKKGCRCLERPWFPLLMGKTPPGLTFHRNFTPTMGSHGEGMASKKHVPFKWTQLLKKRWILSPEKEVCIGRDKMFAIPKS